jgi:5-(carboxyamino)imidazole ribonucleotide mutase
MAIDYWSRTSAASSEDKSEIRNKLEIRNLEIRYQDFFRASDFGFAPCWPCSCYDPTIMIAIIMGSKSDWETMRHAAEMLDQLGVAYEKRIVSAHRTPDLLFEYASTAESRGVRVIIAGAGGAAHLPGMCASKTTLPVLGVPVQSKALNGLDSLLSIVQMPAGIPVGTLAIGEAGAKNAAIFAAQIVALNDSLLSERLKDFRARQTQAVLDTSL